VRRDARAGLQEPRLPTCQPQIKVCQRVEEQAVGVQLLLAAAHADLAAAAAAAAQLGLGQQDLSGTREAACRVVCLCPVGGGRP